MKLFWKLNLCVGLVLNACLVIVAAVAYFDLEESAKQVVRSQAKLMMAAAEATRAYTNQDIKKMLATMPGTNDQFHKPQVPAFAARRVFEELQKIRDKQAELQKIKDKQVTAKVDLGKYLFKEASDNPTRDKDYAEDWEKVIIADWRKDKAAGKQIKDVEDYHITSEVDANKKQLRYWYIARPITVPVNDNCLNCHGNQDDVPTGMLDSGEYGRSEDTKDTDNGFCWKEGDIIGARIVLAPMAEVDNLRWPMFTKLLIELGLVTAATLLALNVPLYFLIIRPVRRLSEWSNEVSTGDMKRGRMPVKGNDEIAELTESFNRMYGSVLSAMNFLKKPKK